MATLLCLDVSGAYDNIRKRRIGGVVANWIAGFLQDRRTRIKLQGYHSEFLLTETGITQELSVSLICYLYYNADLVPLRNDPDTGYNGHRLGRRYRLPHSSAIQ